MRGSRGGQEGVKRGSGWGQEGVECSQPTQGQERVRRGSGGVQEGVRSTRVAATPPAPFRRGAFRVSAQGKRGVFLRLQGVRGARLRRAVPTPQRREKLFFGGGRFVLLQGLAGPRGAADGEGASGDAQDVMRSVRRVRVRPGSRAQSAGSHALCASRSVATGAGDPRRGAGDPRFGAGVFPTLTLRGDTTPFGVAFVIRFVSRQSSCSASSASAPRDPERRLICFTAACFCSSVGASSAAPRAPRSASCGPPRPVQFPVRLLRRAARAVLRLLWAPAVLSTVTVQYGNSPVQFPVRLLRRAARAALRLLQAPGFQYSNSPV
eukprot:1195545-Prorocentrum_minimum.AAC.2